MVKKPMCYFFIVWPWRKTAKSKHYSHPCVTDEEAVKHFKALKKKHRVDKRTDFLCQWFRWDI